MVLLLSPDLKTKEEDIKKVIIITLTIVVVAVVLISISSSFGILISSRWFR